MRLVIAALLVVLLAAPTLVLAAHENNIGLYVTPTPSGTPGTLDPDEASIVVSGPMEFTIYLVCTKPWNFTLDRPIQTVGGFDCYMSLPPITGAVDVELYGYAVDLDDSPEGFFASGLFPATAGTEISSVLLATIRIHALTAPPSSWIHLTPYPDIQTIPGAISVTDADDDFSPHTAFPSSGDYGLPIFGINTGVVPTEDATWSELKALYR